MTTKKTKPDLFELSNDHVQITYSTTSLSGQPLLTYKDENNPQFASAFSGSEIRTEKSELGLLVSASVFKTIDQGYTSLTLVLPDIVLAEAQGQSFNTIAVITNHLLGIRPGFQGAREIYSVLQLSGTARFVQS